MIRVMFFGDVVGEPGRDTFQAAVAALKAEHQPDFIVVNGENAAGGRGITPKIAIELMRYGADVITLGDHAWDQREILPYFETEPRLIRPYNFPPGVPGEGSVVVSGNGKKLGVLNALGNTFMGPSVDNPFLTIKERVTRLREETPAVLLDFHAEATSEKIAMGRFLDGTASIVVGTHTHVQTADDRILPGGTAYLTDAGYTGGHDSVIGRDVESVLQKYQTLLPNRFHIAKNGCQADGLVADLDEATGHAVRLQRLQWQPPDIAPEEESAPA
ncbi:MAG: TIGR00282 family metallophosphoesterase [Verrucomicrobiota bacterium]